MHTGLQLEHHDTEVFTEKRREIRFTGAFPVELNGKAGGITRDFSAQGIYFTIDRIMSVGESAELVVKLGQTCSDMPVRVRCRGKVLRVEPAGGRIGVAVALHYHCFEED